MKAKLTASKIKGDDGKVKSVLVKVIGNVGAEGRAKLEAMGMQAEADVANCRSKRVYNDAEYKELVNALLNAELIEK